jgi:hypothetical protein
MVPIIELFGKAGSGKDTIASFIKEEVNAQIISFADPMKRFAQAVFDFSDQQLWGPSQHRNAIDPRYADPWYWTKARQTLENCTPIWFSTILGPNDQSFAWQLLIEWFEGQRKIEEITPRRILQTLGTQWGRRVNNNMWVDHTVQNAMRLLSGECCYSAKDGLRHAPDAKTPDLIVIPDGRFRNEILGVAKWGGIVVRIDGQNLSQEAGKAGIANHASEKQDGIPDYFFNFVVYNDKNKGLGYCQEQVKKMLNQILRPSIVIGTGTYTDF